MEELKRDLAEKARAYGQTLLGVISPETAHRYAGIEVA